MHTEKEIVIEGFVNTTYGPVPESPEFNGWKFVTLMVWAMILFPFFLLLWIFRMMLFLAFTIAGLSNFGGDGVMGSLLLGGVLGYLLFRRAEPSPTYYHEVLTDIGGETVVQSGNFSRGMLVPGHQYRLWCSRRKNVLILLHAQDLVSHRCLSYPTNPWPLLFFLTNTLGLLGVICFLMVDSGIL